MLTFYARNYSQEELTKFLEMLTTFRAYMLNCPTDNCPDCNIRHVCKDVDHLIDYLKELKGNKNI